MLTCEIYLSRLGRRGGVQPIGSSTGTVNVAGSNWDLWVGYNGPMKVFSFVAVNEIATFEADLKSFFTHITNAQGFPASQQHLISMSFLIHIPSLLLFMMLLYYGEHLD